MKVLVASSGTTGGDEDFNFCVPGELVRIPADACDCPDCGCERAMAGMASSRGTTCFRVDDQPTLTVDGYRRAFFDALLREGWIQQSSSETKREVFAWADQHLAEAARFEDGDVLSLVNGEICRRT